MIHNKKDDRKIKLRLNHGLEFFINKEKDYLARIEKKKKGKKPNKKALEKRLEDQFKEFKHDDGRLKSLMAA